MSAYNVTAEVHPDWNSPGDNAWQLAASTFVGMQSVPGLMILYAGFMKRKWAINSAFMVFYAFAATMICWVLWAYKASFGEQMLPFVGLPGQVVSEDQLLTQAVLPAANLSASYPLSTLVYFQFVFAAITVIITAGSFLGRMNFMAWIIFVPLWLTLSYTVGAFSIWGGGWLFQYGVIDFAGGFVIHLSSGTAGFVGAYWIGPRLECDRQENRPNNVLLTMTGAGILWLGWNGFNGGAPLAPSPDVGAAVLNTNVCTAMSVLVWVACDLAYFKRASILGAVQGMITGLVAITPAAGYVAGWGAILLAIGSGSIPWFTMNIMTRKIRWFRQVDDAIGVFHTHFVAALVGGLGVGIWATGRGVAAFGTNAPGGAVDGNGMQFARQLVAALFIIGWNVVWTTLILLFIKHVLRIPLRMSEEKLLVGDYAIHGEEPYIFIFSEEEHRNLIYTTDGESPRARSLHDEEAIIEGKSPRVDDQPVSSSSTDAGVTHGVKEIKEA